MTVRELLEELREYHPDAEVTFRASDNNRFTIDPVVDAWSGEVHLYETLTGPARGSDK